MVTTNNLEIGLDIPNRYSGKMLFDKIKEYAKNEGLTVTETCKKLEWHLQQFYLMNDPNRTVKASTITHVIEKLNVDPDWLLSEADPAYAKVMRKFPKEVLEWLVTDKGREVMMEAYGRYLYEKTQKSLQESAEAVYKA